MASLRLSIPDEMFAEVEKYAKTTNTSVAHTARLLLFFGIATAEQMSERWLAEIDRLADGVVV